MFVITDTVDVTTLVASNRPRRPTSTTATSTLSVANQPKAAAQTNSNQLSRSPTTISRSDSSVRISARSRSLIGSPLRRMRSLISEMCGEVVEPTVRPEVANSDSIMATTVPLPLVPVTCNVG